MMTSPYRHRSAATSGTLRLRPDLTLRQNRSVMDLTWSGDEDAFRAEARSWLEANVPHGLPSGDTREGFALHLEW